MKTVESMLNNQRGGGGLHRDLGDRVKVFCAGAGTNIGQTLGKTGSFEIVGR